MNMRILVNIDVPDLDKALAFYQQAFGLSVGRRLGEGVVELLGASSAIYLLAKSEGSVPSPFTPQRRRYQRHWTPVHLDFVVDDIEVAFDKAVAAGATVEQATQTFDWGRLALLADPFGHGLCLVQFLGRGYDEIATG
jgi:predicted enzyme related to lactoylglutathione lyase